MKPTGILFEILLSRSFDKQWQYEVAIDKLPEPTQEAIKLGNFDALPEAIRFSLHSSTKSSSKACWKLSMIEFFLFYLSYIITISPDSRFQTDSKASEAAHKWLQKNFWSASSLQLYLEIVHLYLEYLVPLHYKGGKHFGPIRKDHEHIFLSP